jgi:hypothetical protein
MFRTTIASIQDDYSVVSSPHRAASAASIQGTGHTTPSLSLSEVYPCSVQSSAAAPNASPLQLSGQPPTLAQLAMLTSLPAALVNSRATNSRGGKKSRKGGGLVRDGQVVSRLFDTFGKRPIPRNGLSLEQSITLELELLSQNPIMSATTTGVAVYGAFVFSVGMFSGATSLLGVFDQYMINQIETWIETPDPNKDTGYPDLYSSVDLDDGNVPVSIGQIQDHVGAIVATTPAGHYHKWRPHIAIASYSGTFTSYTNSPATWIDSASPNVQHFGLKLALVANSTIGIGVNVVTRAVITFRAPAIN